MKLFDFFRREQAERPKGDPRSGGASYEENVVYVNSAEKAMRVAAVYRAVNLISSAAALLPLEYKRMDRPRQYFKLPEDAAGVLQNYLLGVKPNPRMNAYTLMKYLVAQVLLTGNAYIYPKRGTGMRVEELVLCSPGSVAYDVYRNRYSIGDPVNGLDVTVDAGDILHFKNLCMDGGYYGQSTVRYAATVLGIAATSDNETLKRFATGGRMKAILRNNTGVKGFGEYQDQELENLGKDLQESVTRGDDILVIKGDGQLDPISMSSSDMQFLENRKFTIREIARFFNVPPSKLMDDTNSNYKSTEVSNVAFYADALQPILTEIEREFTAKLLSVHTYRDYKYQFDLQKLFTLDLDSRAKWNKSRLDCGQASVNDLRRESDKEPVAGGDTIYLSTNLAELGSDKLRGNTGTGSQDDKTGAA